MLAMDGVFFRGFGIKLAVKDVPGAEVYSTGQSEQGNRAIKSGSRRCYLQDFKQVLAIPRRIQSLALNTYFQACFLL
jgi:hypothetical protein